MFRKRALTLGVAFILSFLTLEEVLAVESELDVLTQNAASSEPSYQFPGLTSRLPIQLSLSIAGGYDDNPGTNSSTSSSGGGSVFTSGALLFGYGLKNGRTKLDFTANAGATYYPDLSGQNYDLNEYVRLLLKHDISQRLTLDMAFDAAYRTEPNFATNAGPETRQGNYFQNTDNLSLTYHWTPHVSTVTSVSAFRLSYDNSTTAATENRWQVTAGQQFLFTLPNVPPALVAEYRFGVTYYDTSPRNSITHYLLGGFDQNFGPRFRLTARGGASFTSYDNNNDTIQNNGDSIDPHFETTLEYAGAHHFDVLWLTSYGVEQSNSVGSLDRTTFRTGVQAGYNVLSRVRATAAVFYHHDDDRPFPMAGVAQSDSSSDSFDGSLSLYYAVNRFLFLSVNYSHSEVSSGGMNVGNDYSRNSYSGGITLTY